ncbi:hypothetical protein [uncultured Mucilaginibacter sp.]|uniref:hypothetical protein n=1 Tax=uncultured Mucilaginibacter sp. TaxID=797541 RepID=UPI002638FC32|nr:hypothetical protein [uncultured Mucilaginibacter sp.]
MKKTFLKTATVMLVALIFSACSTLKKDPNAISRGNISGNWGISAVTLEGLLPGAVQSVFNTAPYKCFENSNWKLTNSGSGSFMINNTQNGCQVGFTQNIFWSFANGANGPEFQFKMLFDKDKPKNVEDGYRLLITAMTANTMTLKSPVQYGGKTGYVVYNFVKQ